MHNPQVVKADRPQEAVLPEVSQAVPQEATVTGNGTPTWERLP